MERYYANNIASALLKSIPESVITETRYFSMVRNLTYFMKYVFLDGKRGQRKKKTSMTSISLPCCIVCIRNENGDHHSWILNMLSIRQGIVTLACSYLKRTPKYFKYNSVNTTEIYRSSFAHKRSFNRQFTPL